jgi:hypothetical protein
MQELIVILSCALNTGCKETSSAYIHYNPGVKDNISVIEAEVGKYINKDVAFTLSLLYNKQININLGNNTSLNIKENGVGLTKGF